EPVTGGRGHRGGMAERTAQEVPAQILVPFEPTGGEDDTASCVNVVGTVRSFESHPGDPAVTSVEQTHTALTGVDGDAVVQAALQQCGDHTAAESFDVGLLPFGLHLGRQVAGAPTDRC